MESGAATAACAQHLRAGWEQGRAAYPLVGLSLDDFTRTVRARLRTQDPSTCEQVVLRRPEPSRLADLFLAIACDQRCPGAWEALHRFVLPAVRVRLVHAGLNRAAAEELALAAPGLLLELSATRPDGVPFGAYEGRARLAHWLACVAQRDEQRRFRTDARRARILRSAIARGAMTPRCAASEDGASYSLLSSPLLSSPRPTRRCCWAA